jgi:LacI family transcriptional regulator
MIQIPPTRVPTIRDVARAAGVSVGTASKALNGQGQLRIETRERVQQIASELGFRPNDLMQSLLRQKSFTVGLISTDSYGRFSSPLMEGIEDALGAAQFSVFLCNASDDPVRERQHIESLLSKRVDGIIVTARRTDPRAAIDLGVVGVPILYAYTQTNNPDDLCLLPDDTQGGQLATEHLIRAGRKHIVHITGPEKFLAVRERRAGYEAALKAHGLMLKHSVFTGPWSEAWGYEAVTQLLERDRNNVDAIFCGSDQIARGAVDALRERGVGVPDEIAVVGYDNWEIIAAATRPALTTIDMNLHELGRLAATKLLGLIDGRKLIDGHKDSGVQRFPCRLIARASCGTSETLVSKRKEDERPTR